MSIPTDEEVAQRISDFSQFDTTSAHLEADRTLCELLTLLGYEKTVEAFENLDKWYE